MDDTILRLFTIDCGGLPSIARKRSERAKDGGGGGSRIAFWQNP